MVRRKSILYTLHQGVFHMTRLDRLNLEWEIEKTRARMIKIYNQCGNLADEQVIQASQELDRKLLHYFGRSKTEPNCR